MDANLNESHRQNISKITGSECEIKFHQKPTDPKNVHYTASKDDFNARFTSDLVAGRKIALITNKGDKCVQSYKKLAEQYQLKCQAYSSKTDAGEKRTELSAVNETWQNYDFLAYTPTVLAGVSFELEHYETAYVIVTDKSCDVDSLIQMLRRIRNIDNYVLLYTGGFTEKHIPRGYVYDYYNGKFKLNKKIISDLPDFMYKRDKNGQIDDFSPLVSLWLSHKYDEIHLRHNYGPELIKALHFLGWKLLPLTPCETEKSILEDLGTKDKLKEIAAEYAETELNELVAAKWPESENEAIYKLANDPESIKTTQEQFKVKRFKIGQYYEIANIGQKDISAELFKELSKRSNINRWRMRKIYNELKDDLTAGTLKIENLGNDKTKPLECSAIDKLRFNLELLQIIGFDGLDFEKSISKEIYQKNIITAAKHRNDFKAIELGLRLRSDLNSTQAAANHVNNILENNLGVKLETANHKRTSYKLVDKFKDISNSIDKLK